MESLLMTADEVAKELNVSKNYAYKGEGVLYGRRKGEQKVFHDAR